MCLQFIQNDTDILMLSSIFIVSWLVGGLAAEFTPLNDFTNIAQEKVIFSYP